MSSKSNPPINGYQLYDAVDPFENHVGPFYWQEFQDGLHHFVLKVEAKHCNAYGIVHGGLIMIMADLAMAAASKNECSDRYVTIAFKSEFVDSGYRGELLECWPRLTRRSGLLSFVQGKVDVGERTLVIFSGVMKRVR